MEQHRRERREGTPPPAFPEASARPATVAVRCGPYEEDLPVAGMTVGQVRQRYRDALDIGPDAEAWLDHHKVDDSVRIATGQTLMFARHAGEKGSMVRRLLQRLREAEQAAETRSINETRAAPLPPRPAAASGVPDAGASARTLDSGGYVLPSGVRMLDAAPGCQVIVHETRPQAHALTWFGRPRVLSLPWVVVVVVLGASRHGRFFVVDRLQQVYFRNEPLRNADDQLLLPAFENMTVDHGLPVMCLGSASLAEVSLCGAKPDWLTALHWVLDRVFHAGFNGDLSHHSLFLRSAESKIDARVATLDAWEEATRQDAVFATTVNWLPSDVTLREAVRRSQSIVASSRGPTGEDRIDELLRLSRTEDAARWIAERRSRRTGAEASS